MLQWNVLDLESRIQLLMVMVRILGLICVVEESEDVADPSALLD